MVRNIQNALKFPQLCRCRVAQAQRGGVHWTTLADLGPRFILQHRFDESGGQILILLFPSNTRSTTHI